MPLASGSRLGPYEIVAPLGAGGMGEVYRARDTRLDRTVAIKILPPHFADDATRRQRFEREAKVVSSLNHPNICTLHDIGQQDGVDFIVMEFLEGESLAERLQQGALPAPQVMQYGTQLASALDKAHRSGVTHRDLKPGNIILTKSGAKLLDFGLAKADSWASLGKTLTDATPHPLPMTKMGTVIGTVPYMSPEQVDGKETDARSDIFSLGAVLYEMVTGKRPFQGQSDFGIASAILHKDPAPISTLQPLTPPALERTIRVCLAKDPDERWQSASDLWNELRWISESSSQSGAATVPLGGTSPGSRPGSGNATAVRHGIRPGVAWMTAGLFAMIAGFAIFVALRSGRTHKALVFRQLNFRREAIFQAAFAGDTIVYSAANSDNTPQIFAVRPDYPEPQAIGPRGTTLLAVSSKGELAVLLNAHYLWYRLFTGTLARMTLSGGAPREIEDNVRQADWSPDGSQLAVIREVAGKVRLEYPIGHVLHEVSGSLSDLRFSPRGDYIAFFEHPRKLDDRGSVNIVDLSGNNTLLSEGYWSLRGLAWAPRGDEILFSASENGGSYAVYGVTMAGKRRLAYQAPGGFTIQDVDRDGRWLATRLDFRYAAMVHTPDVAGDRDLSWLNTSHARALSQDGQTLLFSETALGTNYAVCLRKTDGSPVLRLGEGWAADLSADGKWVLAVVQSIPPKLLIYPTGAGETRQLERGQIEHYSTAKWFRDGKSVLICGNEPGKGTRFYVQELGGTPKAVTPEGTRDGLLSADGKFVLARGPDGKYSVYPIAGGAPQPVPGLTEPDIVALWSADRKSALVYHLAEIPDRLMHVDLATGRRTLFREFAPTDRTGLLSLREVFVTDDLRSYAYTAYYQVSSLFVSDGKE
ncbi:MAG TPA: protein kinase [Candidatus Sulfotelmatobacter sp.]|nr:protein kinase [Candidatus Sulfotelmatobacter sp.]